MNIIKAYPIIPPTSLSRSSPQANHLRRRGVLQAGQVRHPRKVLQLQGLGAAGYEVM